ncbi:hypothetical protein H5410_000055 [Solanum commersonii]|uniref:Secreted protein n=1 Tax=Solanum commersonii TaxID=4109 RepID=A0A9J6AVQ6_SOLCO|nr:hypothetical protein H5410_000055 [Solanum commersonii]
MAGLSKVVATILLMLMLWRRRLANLRAAGSRGYASIRGSVVSFAVRSGLVAAIAMDSVTVASAPNSVN